MPAPSTNRPQIFPDELPLLALRSTIVFPHGKIAVQVGTTENLALLRSLDAANGLVVVAVALGPNAEDLDRLVDRIAVVEIPTTRIGPAWRTTGRASGWGSCFCFFRFVADDRSIETRPFSTLVA